MEGARAGESLLSGEFGFVIARGFFQVRADGRVRGGGWELMQWWENHAGVGLYFIAIAWTDELIYVDDWRFECF